jgi:hypothetical protein
MDATIRRSGHDVDVKTGVSRKQLLNHSREAPNNKMIFDEYYSE